LMRALEKDRTRRYDTAGNLAADIQRHLDNEPVLAKPPSATYAMRKFVSRHRIGMLAGGAVLMALLVGFTLATVGFFRANSERDIAVKARTEAQTQKEIADKARIDAQSERKLAIENARKSDANARDAKLQLAIGLVSQADALRLARRFTEARQHYIEAVDKFAELKESPAAAEAGLWSLYRQTKSPLMSYNGHDAEVTSAAIAPTAEPRFRKREQHTEGLGPGQRQGAAQLQRTYRWSEQCRHRAGWPNRALRQLRQDAEALGFAER